ASPTTQSESPMSDRHQEAPDNTNRRAFLQNAMTAGAAIAGASIVTGCATGSATVGAQTAAAPASRANVAPAANESPAWDMSWQNRLGRYKMVYDVPDPQKGDAYSVIASTIQGYKAALPVTAKEFTPVLVLRHTAVVAALNDAMWKRLKANERLTDKTTSAKFAERNPFYTYIDREQSFVYAESAIATLMQNGTTVLACNRALTGLASTLRRNEPDTFKTVDDALAEIRRNLQPGITPMPNGLFAVAAAQDAGCGYMRIIEST
ncbi:MAG: hypothetical protein ACO1Q7_20785, partial [Gemmatimonas sp.]